MSIRKLKETLLFDTVPIIKDIEKHSAEVIEKNIRQIYFLNCFRNFCIWIFGFNKNFQRFYRYGKYYRFKKGYKKEWLSGLLETKKEE